MKYIGNGAQVLSKSKLTKRIEFLRNEIIEMKKTHSFTEPKMIELSVRLDEKLNEYNTQQSYQTQSPSKQSNTA